MNGLSKAWEVAHGLAQGNKGRGEKGLEGLEAGGEGSGRD